MSKGRGFIWRGGYAADDSRASARVLTVMALVLGQVAGLQDTVVSAQGADFFSMHYRPTNQEDAAVAAAAYGASQERQASMMQVRNDLIQKVHSRQAAPLTDDVALYNSLKLQEALSDGYASIYGSIGQQDPAYAGATSFVNTANIGAVKDGITAAEALRMMARAREAGSRLSEDAAALVHDMQDMSASFGNIGQDASLPSALSPAGLPALANMWGRGAAGLVPEFQAPALFQNEAVGIGMTSIIDANGDVVMALPASSADLAAAIGHANAAAARAEAAVLQLGVYGRQAPEVAANVTPSGTLAPAPAATADAAPAPTASAAPAWTGVVGFCGGDGEASCGSIMKFFTLNYQLTVTWAIVHWGVVIVFWCLFMWCCLRCCGSGHRRQ